MPSPSAPPAVRQPDHVGIRVRDLDAAVAFYRDLLGLREFERHPMPNGTTLVVLEMGSAGYVELVHRTDFSEAVAIPGKQAGLQHFCLQVDNLDAWVSYLKAKDVPLTAGPFDLQFPSGPVRGLFIADPEGNPVELMERTSR